eukprot:15365645-Ditylum_brightwellii.AAC.1
MTITCGTFFLHMVDWRFYFINWVSYCWIVIQEEIDAALFKQHLWHFSQAAGTPFTTNPIMSKFGEYAKKSDGVKYRDRILNLQQIGVDKYIKEFLTGLQHQPYDPPAIDTTITLNNIKRNYKSWKEATSTSSSDRREALDIVIGKTTTVETLHLQQANFGCMDCDAKACYDCIIPLVLLLAYYKAGLLYNTYAFLVMILYSLKYTPEWVVGRGYACFVKSQKSKIPGLNPGWGQLKLESVAVGSVTGACRGGRSWLLTAL